MKGGKILLEKVWSSLEVVTCFAVICPRAGGYLMKQQDVGSLSVTDRGGDARSWQDKKSLV